MPDEGRRLAYQPALDGLRAVAVLTVLLHHYGFRLAQGGYIGVDVFFVLSGYLITTLALREREISGRIDLRAFWWRRARRLLPSLFVVCAFTLVAYGLDHQALDRTATLVGVPTALAYIMSWVVAFDWWRNGFMSHTWSLSIEEWFYALFPIGLVVFARRSSDRWKYARRSPARWVHTATAIAIAYWAVAANVLHWDSLRLYFAPDTRSQQLLIGCSLAVALRAGLLARIPTRVRQVLLIAAVVTLALWVPNVYEYSDLYLRWGLPLTALAAAVIVWHLIESPRGWLGTALSVRPAIWIGQRSYTIYLIHYVLIGLIIERFTRLKGFALVLTVSLVWAGLSYRWVEARFLKRRALSRQ